MAEAIATDLAAGLISKLFSLAAEQVIQAWKLDEDLKHLRERLESICALLNDAYAKNPNMAAVKDWFHKLEAVVTVAEVLMDELEYEVTRRKVENQVHRKVRNFFSPNNSIAYRFKVAGRIKSINTSFDKISKRATDIGLQAVPHLGSIVQHREMRNTPPVEDESLIVGRDNDISYLVNMLCDKTDEVLTVNAIIGMAGQGKTTLARMVYNKDRVNNMFPKKMWVTVSDDFYFMKILNQMRESLTSQPSLLQNAEGLIKDLQEKLKGEKFLLVLDDVWNEKPDEWEKLSNSLLGVAGARGSKVLVTTRSTKVTDAMRCADPYWVKKLSEEDSWELFKRRAFSSGGVSESEAFEAMGRSMVEMCRGLPLAIKALGGSLYAVKTEQEWSRIQNSEIWKSKGVLPSLRLSYDNLTLPSLKRCFAYCSIMPKDSDIYKDKLIQEWMALGFLSGDSNALMEDIGNEYFDIMLWNSLLQDVAKDVYGNITKCKMHDLVHDLAVDVSSTYSTTVKSSDDFRKVTKAVHVRLDGFKDVKSNVFKAKFDTVRALHAEANVLHVMRPNLKHLRVLVLNSFCEDLHSWIENLKCLKHLYISSRYRNYDDTAYKLPISITRLYNLQTLRIESGYELPEKVCNLINLRHLVIDKYDRRCMFTGIERLTFLQTLPHFIVSRDKNCFLGQLGGLKNLRGELRLYGLNEVANIEEASEAKLFEKSDIWHLLLNWRGNENEREDREYNHEDVMEGLEPHPNLKKLSIEDFMGKKLSSWIARMPNLVDIILKSCNRCEVLSPLGLLPKLREIYIDGMKYVKVIADALRGDVDTTTLYPSLVQLTLYELPKLEEWVETVTSAGVNGQSVFPKLESLNIWDCPRLRKFPNSCFPSLKKLHISDLESSSVLETMSATVSSLTSLMLLNVRDERGGDSSSNMESVTKVLLENNYVSLTELTLIGCKAVKRLTLGASLDTLCLDDCPDLMSITFDEKLKCLKSLTITEVSSSVLDGVFSQKQSFTVTNLELGPFTDEVDEFPWPFSSSSLSNSFPNLIDLTLLGWEKVKSIPFFEQLHFSTFPALTRIDIYDFDGMKALLLSVAKLPSLKKLHISNCKNLESLSMFDQSHCLESLYISGCPILKERYSRRSGPEWFQIHRIPHIIIDRERFQICGRLIVKLSGTWQIAWSTLNHR